jgi:hypothetical protein
MSVVNNLMRHVWRAKIGVVQTWGETATSAMVRNENCDMRNGIRCKGIQPIRARPEASSQIAKLQLDTSYVKPRWARVPVGPWASL